MLRLAIEGRGIKAGRVNLSDLGLSPHLVEAFGFKSPTPIQEAAIPAVLAGKDVLGVAKTGSGKTASYVLPLLQGLIERGGALRNREPAILVLVPTRELAEQVREIVSGGLGQLETKLRCLSVCGGGSVNPQMRALERVDFLVATPGRLLDLIGKNAVTLSAVRTLVLDEADKMLSLGFQKEVDELLSLLPETRQTVLFSATGSAILSQRLRDPVVIDLVRDHPGESGEAAPLIRQTAYQVTEERKGPLLRYLIRTGEFRQVLVFVSSTQMADRVWNKLLKNKITAGAIHSKISQGGRKMALAKFRAGEIQVLIATDLLSRGVDLEALPCVINYELPRSPKDYVHRIGRTGRADREGDAISLISPDEEHHFRVIQKKMGVRVPMKDGAEISLHGM